eukprot:CAMPEP_0178463930 /NCGR_PEP_ID=MMETSP0689_2-20121128/50585_1 /TAXON_ID=160604 /ORGANISM="Amphidinium massartii, Strain CS-259" /LENGTH=1200 /DNA_ID=CAMNT_0020090825 /DNA_START=30 /DNA_END=3630 /DNA_ORIENTATION=-
MDSERSRSPRRGASAAAGAQGQQQTGNLAHLLLDQYWNQSRAQADRLLQGGETLGWGPNGLHDFEAFLQRYMQFLQRQEADYGLPSQGGAANDDRVASSNRGSSSLNRAQRMAAGLPRPLDRQLRQNFSIALSAGWRAREEDGARGGQLGPTLLKHVVQLYEDFMAFQGLKKLQQNLATLPIAQQRKAIVEAVQQHPIVLIAGDTGCGKSTQVPQYLMEAGFRRTLVTQPRRLAAVSLARRVAHERLEPRGSKGSVVGHQVRFDSSRSSRTRILFVTEGILLRLLEADVEVRDFNVIIVDEVHERNITTDILLALLAKVVEERRDDLKLVLMSATLQKSLFMEFFQLPEAAVITVPGRCYPVETEFMELPNESECIRNDIVRRPKKQAEFDSGPYIAVLQKIEDQIKSDERGDVLIFLPGVREIDALVAAISEFSAKKRRWLPLPLHSQLPVEQQDKAFDIAPPGMRKVVMATNIAETSVTLDGVRFVIDSGKMREMDVDCVSAVQHLQERWVSRASADQRKGRAGRTGPGRCIRLFSEKLFNRLDPFAAPEIRRAALESPLLQVLALGFDLMEVHFPERPSTQALAAALRRLLLLRAVVPIPLSQEGVEAGAGADSLPGMTTSDGSAGDTALLKTFGLLGDDLPEHQLVLTPLGRVLSRLPVNVGVGKILLLALVFSVQAPAVVLAAATGLRSPRAQRFGERSEGGWDFDHHSGDLFTSLLVYQAWLKERAEGSRERRDRSSDGAPDARSRRWAREHGVDEAALFELTKLNVQLCDLLKESAGQVQGRGRGLGGRLRLDRMEKLEAAMRRGSLYEDGRDPLPPGRREELERELEELKELQSRRQRRQLEVAEGEGVLAQDNHGLGCDLEDASFGGRGDGDIDDANASGGEGKPSRELNRTRRPKKQATRNVRLPKNDGLAERMRLRNVEFELRYASHIQTASAMERLSGKQETLLELVVCCSLYPNIALPHAKNRERPASECVFQTRQVQFANLHPGSVLFPEIPTTLTTREGLAFGSILQTRLPFLTHVTRCPVLPVALLCAHVVELAPDCDMLVCDGWLQLAGEDREAFIKMVGDAHRLRRSIRRALDSELVTLFEADCDDDVPEDLLEPAGRSFSSIVPKELREVLDSSGVSLEGTALQDLAVSFWRRKVKCQWQTLLPREHEAMCKAAVATNEPVQVASWLRYGAVSEVGLQVTD